MTFRCRPGPSTCQGLRLMSLIFRTQSARVALMSRERVRCPRGLCGIHPDVSVYRGTRESAGDCPGPAWFEPVRTATDDRKGCRTNVCWTLFHDRSSRRPRHSHLPTYDKKRGGSRLPPQIHLAFSPLSRWNETDISPLNGARGGTTKRDLVVLKFARVPAPFFAILKQPM